MILSVKLNDTFKFGVNFSALRDKANTALVSGTPAQRHWQHQRDRRRPAFRLPRRDRRAVSRLPGKNRRHERDRVPRLTCLNKQRAEIQIGEELGYVSTTVTASSSTQTINFLSVGTLLRMRPYIGNDGLIRLEVHPELSTGTVKFSKAFRCRKSR